MCIIIMVKISDGSSEHCAHIWSKPGIWLQRQRRQIPNLFWKRPILLSKSTICAEPPSYISTMIIMVYIYQGGCAAPALKYAIKMHYHKNN